jgi:hypothetical protein
MLSVIRLKTAVKSRLHLDTLMYNALANEAADGLA